MLPGRGDSLFTGGVTSSVARTALAPRRLTLGRLPLAFSAPDDDLKMNQGGRNLERSGTLRTPVHVIERISCRVRQR